MTDNITRRQLWSKFLRFFRGKRRPTSIPAALTMQWLTEGAPTSAGKHKYAAAPLMNRGKAHRKRVRQIAHESRRRNRRRVA